MTQIQAIQTRYKGYHFRSRLEARWAVFFDALGLQWEYEPEGFERVITWNNDEAQAETIRYLPDFYLPETCTWVEVKGGRPIASDVRKMACMLDWEGPLPHFEGSDDATTGRPGLLLLGNIPEQPRGPIFHPIITHHEGLIRRFVVFCGKRLVSYPENWFVSVGISLAIGMEYGRKFSRMDGFAMSGSTPDEVDFFDPKSFPIIGTHRPDVFYAYQAARSARFEHGQSGAS